MEKHLLLTVSDKISSLQAVHFTTHFFSNKSNLKITLLYIAPDPKAGLGRSPQGQEVLEAQQLKSAYQKKGHAALQKADSILQHSGHPVENILTKFKFRSFSTVKDIIQEAEVGLYDAIVLGRRGISRLEEFFEDSISMQMFEENVSIPFWICREPDLERKNVLLCIDGSESSYRIADHVGFLLQTEPQNITLFHVQTEDSGPKEKIMSQALQALEENNFPAARVEQKTIAASVSNITQTILDEAQKGKYAVVAVGYSGTHREKGIFKRFQLGSVTQKLCYDLRGSVLWVSK
jgi:nucleotide-binding universal stress UspA family protein